MFSDNINCSLHADSKSTNDWLSIKNLYLAIYHLCLLEAFRVSSSIFKCIANTYLLVCFYLKNKVINQ